MEKYFYRPHRGGLKEAMDEHKFFDSMQEMIDYVVEDWNSFASYQISADDVTVRLYCDKPDIRIGWKNTFIILVQGNGYAFYTDSYDKNWGSIYWDYIKPVTIGRVAKTEEDAKKLKQEYYGNDDIIITFDELKAMISKGILVAAICEEYTASITLDDDCIEKLKDMIK